MSGIVDVMADLLVNVLVHKLGAVLVDVIVYTNKTNVHVLDK